MLDLCVNGSMLRVIDLQDKYSRRREAMKQPTDERLARNTEIQGDCIVWTGCKDRKGYGQLQVGRSHMGAHRYAWQLVNGQIPAGMLVCHTCDNPSCVNVNHLWLGTYTDNNRDRDRKGRGVAGERVGTSRLTPDKVMQIRSRLAAGMAHVDIASEFGVHETSVGDIRRARRWVHLGITDMGPVPPNEAYDRRQAWRRAS